MFDPQQYYASQDRRAFFDRALIAFAQLVTPTESGFEQAAERAAHLLQVREASIDVVAPLHTGEEAQPSIASQELGATRPDDDIQEIGGAS